MVIVSSVIFGSVRILLQLSRHVAHPYRAFKDSNWPLTLTET